MKTAQGKTANQVTIIGKPQPRSWQDYREGALANYGGGHRTDGHLEAFQHGMETVFRLIEAEFPPAPQCKSAPELLKWLDKLVTILEEEPLMWNSAEEDLKAAREVIKKAQGD